MTLTAGESARAAVEPVATLSDTERIEQMPLADREVPDNTYEMLLQGVALTANQTVLSFFLDTKELRRPIPRTGVESLADIRRTANALRGLGMGRSDVVAILMPNPPETHFAIWGSEAASVPFRALGKLQRDVQKGLNLPVFDLRAEMKNERAAQLNFDAPQAQDRSSYLCTGGTTGLPKIAVRTHRSEVLTARRCKYLSAMR